LYVIYVFIIIDFYTKYNFSGFVMKILQKGYRGNQDRRRKKYSAVFPSQEAIPAPQSSCSAPPVYFKGWYFLKV